MSFFYKERPSDSPHVEAVWQTEDSADGVYLAAADGSWDLIFVTQDNETSVLLSGPSSRATPVTYRQGNRNFGIRFKPGVLMAKTLASSMLDVTSLLPKKSATSFWFQGESWKLPSFDNTDTFIAKLEQQKLLAGDDVVQTVLDDRLPDISMRTIQRHFLHATGLTPRYMQLIRRANQAVVLLQQGEPIATVVQKLGYADQAHMTRQVKHISGCTPGAIVKKVETCRLRSIQRYGVCAEMRVQNFKGASYGNKTIQNSDQAV